MKLLNNELQAELLNFFQAAQEAGIRLPDQPLPAYFLEELRPKRVRKTASGEALNASGDNLDIVAA